jgi:hypothetical protein
LEGTERYVYDRNERVVHGSDDNVSSEKTP